MRILAKTRYDDKHWLVFHTDFLGGYQPKNFPGTNLVNTNDIQVVLCDDEGNRLDDAICHYGSYGVEVGLWEVMSESLPKEGDNVEGYLTWKQVEKYFDKTIRNRAKKK